MDVSRAVWNLTWIGAGIGAVIAYLSRPSLPLMGQLPFWVVITRGASLDPMSQLVLGRAAAATFNRMLIDGILGAVAGFLIAIALLYLADLKDAITDSDS